MELLRIEHLKKVYHTRLGLQQCVALKDVSFAVEEGLESVDVLITDAKLRPEQKSALEEAGLDVRMAPENQ